MAVGRYGCEKGWGNDSSIDPPPYVQVEKGQMDPTKNKKEKRKQREEGVTHLDS